MNQIPNIEKTNTREIEEFFTQEDEFGYSVDKAASGGDLNSKEYVRELLTPKLHQQLQKAREDKQWKIWKQLADLGDDRGILNIDLDDVHKIIFTKNSVTVEETTPLPEYFPWKNSFDALTTKKSSDHSELDEDKK